MLKMWKIFCLSVMFCSVGLCDNIKVVARVDDPSSIYLGDVFSYQIIIDGVSKPGEVDLSPLEKWSPSGYAGRNLSQSSITIINGRKSVEEVRRYVMQYQLKAFSVGEFTIPSVEVVVDGQNYKTNPVKINVLTPGRTDKMEVKVEVSDEVCYAGQPVTLTINWYIFDDIKNFVLSFDGFESDDFYFENNPAFVEPLGKEATVNVSGIEVPAYQKEGLLRGRQGLLVRLEKVLIPKEAGEFDLGSVMVNADIAVGNVRSSGRNYFDDFFNGDRKRYERFAVESEPVSLTVKALPEKGRPDSFYGLVGKYNIVASADAAERAADGKLKVAVGEPITLTVKVGPADFPGPIKAPNLSEIKGFAENFKIPSQQSDPKIEGNYKIFTQTIRAENDGITEIPSIPLSYFDVDSGDYRVVESESIPIEVTAATKLTAGDFIGGGGSAGRELERVRQGLSANYDSPDALKDHHFALGSALTEPVYFGLWAGSVGLVVLSLIYKITTYSSPKRRQAKVRRNASGKLVRNMKNCKADDYEKIVSGMKQFVGERFNRPWQSLTGGDCFEEIFGHTGDEEISGRYKKMLEEYEAACYSPFKRSFEEGKVKEIIDIAMEIDKKAK